MSDIKEVYDSKPARIVKNIFTGMGVVISAIALILGVILLCPVLIVIAGSIAQVGGWVLIIGIAILLPAWVIGKVAKRVRGKQPEIKPEIIDLTEEDVEPDFSDMEKAHKEEIDALRKEVKKAKQEAKALRLDRKEKFNKKVNALKDSAGDLKNAVSALFK
jgi:type VI protein secretion system component VasK